MKTTIHLLTVLTIHVFAGASAQNVAIRTLDDDPNHEFNAVAGCPLGWPIVVDFIGTNSASPHANRFIVTEQQLASIYRNNGAAFTNWHTTTWANYVRTNSAAMEARRASLLAELRALQNRLDSLSNVVDFTAATAPLVASNLVRLQQLQLRLNQ
jgi:hypothetical protein